MNYTIENGLNFYETLKQIIASHDDEKNEQDGICPISNTPLEAHFFTFECGHKFNYAPLFKDVYNHKKKYNHMENGKGQLTLKTCVARHVMLKKYQHKLALELQVMDNGPGIRDEIREKMFFPLVSGREGGTGLGLTLAQTFIQHHGGAIEVDSEPGRTCFRIIFPL